MEAVLQPDRLFWMAAIVIAAGVTRGFTGFGAGLILVPSLSLLLGPRLAVPIVVLLDAIGSLPLMPGSVRSVRWRTLAPLVIAAWILIPVGSLGLISLDPVLLRRAVSVIVVVMAALLWSGWRYRRQPTLAISASAGAAGGFLTGIAGIGGPPVVLFYLAGQESGTASRAGLIWYVGLNQFVALATFAWAGLLTRTVLFSSLLLLPLFLLAVFAGSRLFGRVNEIGFRRVALGVLVIVGILGLFY